MIQTSILSNGIRLVTDKMDDVETVSLGIWVSVGSAFEEERVNGISHLLEHMAFKGTLTRSALQIAEQIENVGGIINAYTSRDVTAYYVKVLKEDVHLAFNLLADIYQNSTMDAEELAKEKGVILQEIGQTYDTPDDAIFEHFQKTAYKDQPFGRSILGTSDGVSALYQEDLLDYMHQEYTAKRTIISAAGNISHDWLETEADKLFSNLRDHGGRVAEKPIYTPGDYREQKDIEQVNIVFGVPGMTYMHPLFYAQSVLSTLLGGGMSSRLFQEIREKRGLVYSVYSFVAAYKDSALFGIYAGTGEKQAGELLPVACDLIMDVTATLNDEEIDRAKAQLKAHLLMKSESTSARCEMNARNLDIYGRVVPKEEIIQKIQIVDKDALQQTMFELLRQTPTLATLGPVDYVMPYDDFKRKLSI